MDRYRNPVCFGVGHLCTFGSVKNFGGVRHLMQLRPPYQWVDSTQRRLDLEVGIPSGRDSVH